MHSEVGYLELEAVQVMYHAVRSWLISLIASNESRRESRWIRKKKKQIDGLVHNNDRSFKVAMQCPPDSVSRSKP